MSPQDYSGMNVLVVDDQEHVRTFIRRILAASGVQRVTEAGSGRAAIARVTALGAEPFDLILCDLNMPEMDGVETIRALANLGVRTSVAILSIEHERVIEGVGFLATISGINLVGECSKPLTPEKLEPILSRVAAGVASAQRETPDIAVAELEAAMERNELEVLFQPIVTMRGGQCGGVEATVLWKHPQHGLLEPEVVIRLAEQSRELLVQLTTRTLREALAACARWREDGREIGVNVNLSPVLFDQLDLPEFAQSMTSELKVPPAMVTIEVAERSLTPEHLLAMVDIAARLRIKGFRLALDEFGGGNAGVLEMLKIPFTDIKFDRSIVDGCSEADNRRAVLEAGLAIAHTMKISTTAVGVAKRPDWNLLAERGCDAAQGRFIARPMSEIGIGVWVTQWMLQQR